MSKDIRDRAGNLGLSADDELPVPLAPLESFAGRPEQPATDDVGAAGLPDDHDHLSGRTAAEFSAERMLRRPSERPNSGWRRMVFDATGGLVRLDPSAAELRHRELIARVKTPVDGCRKVAFISRKGGVGKTTTCLLT